MSIPNNNDIAPDVPQMRSVLIRSAEAPSIPSRSSLQFNSKSGKPHCLSYVVPSIKSRAGSSWKPCNVPKLPEVYMLERSHVSIPDADALEIAERIAECLRTQSITASFDDVSIPHAINGTPTRLGKFQCNFTHLSGAVVRGLEQSRCGNCLPHSILYQTL